MASKRTYQPDRACNTQPKHVGAKNELLATVWLMEQGFDVFRNVSAHGFVDIIAIKDGQIHLFDVKGSKTAGLHAEQAVMNVRVLWVLPDGTCGIAPPQSAPPRLHRGSKSARERSAAVLAGSTETLKEIH